VYPVYVCVFSVQVVGIVNAKCTLTHPMVIS